MMQCVLESDKTCLTAWLEYNKRLYPGVIITLKNHEEPGRKWEIKSVSSDMNNKAELRRRQSKDF